MNIADINKVIILGSGGTGSFIIPAIARYLRSQNYNGEFIIVDGDVYEDHNVERQLFSLQFEGMNKAEYQANAVSSQLPDFAQYIRYIDKYLNQEDIDNLIEEGTVVINCVDNNAARKYVEDRIATLQNGAHICCGNDLYIGQVQIYYRCNGIDITPTIYKAVPSFDTTADDRSKLSCEEMSALPSGGQIICANMMAASLALNYFVQLTSDNPIFLNGQFIPTSGTWFNTLLGTFDLTDKKRMSLNQILEGQKSKKETIHVNG